MKIDDKMIDTIVNRVLDELRNELLETAPLPPHIKNKRAKERAQDTKERQRQYKKERKKLEDKNKAVKPFDEIFADFSRWSNGIMNEEEDEVDEAKKKPACGGVKGSALYHDENGHFTGKKDATVRSLKKHTGSDCRHGTTRVKGKNDSIGTKLPCGSKKQDSGGGSGKHPTKCKDSSKA
jgi:hypothetical protein